MAKRKKPKRRRGPRAARRTPQQLIDGLIEAESLMGRKRWDQAREILEFLNQRYPRRVEVLTALVNLHYETRDTQQYQSACEELIKQIPDDPDLTLALAGAYLTNLRPALALRTFRHFLDRWPDHKRADEVRESVAGLEAKMDGIQADMGLIGKDGLELMALHEEVQSLLEQGRIARARNVAEQLLRRRPEFAPALNNISQTYFIEGKAEQAIATAQQVLSFDPDNHHALSNLTRYLCLSGRLDEAREWAGQLKAVQSEAMGVWVKKAEALSYLGDDQGMLDVFAGAGQAGYLKSSLVDPLLYHLAAVATMRLGDEKQARRYWKQALKLPSGLDLARDNLADLRRPVDQRHAPWAFDLSNWVSPQAVEDLVAHLERGNRRKSDAAITRASRHYLERHPEITGLVPLLLDRGDPGGREFALRIALMAETPEMLDALRDFALSQRGPDPMRNEAARAASEAGLLPAGPVRLWMQGKWREILLLSFELHDEILWKHSQRVEQWLTEATLALQQGKADRAERLLQQALEIDPEAPDLLNNLAAAYELQGRVQEAETLVRQIHERFPDYVFARTGLARIHLSREEIEQAEDLLEPLFSRQRLHFYEFGAFCDVQVQILVAKGELEGARSWLDMWATADPENPAIARWRRRLGKGRRRR